jgi:hypothetical protein
MQSKVDPYPKTDVQLPAHPHQDRRAPLDRRLSDPPYRPSPDATPASAETKQPVLERIKTELGRLAKQAEAIDEALLAHLIDTSLHAVENALEQLRWQAENGSGIKGKGGDG